MIDWGIADCLTFNNRHSMHILDENKTVHDWNSDETIGETTFDCHCKSMDSWEGIKKLVFCSGYNAPSLYRNMQKRSLTCKERGSLQAH